MRLFEMPLAVDYFIHVAQTLEDKVLVPYLTPLEQRFLSFAQETMPGLYTMAENFLANNQSMLAKKLPLMNLFHVLAITAAYLVVVFGGKWVMQNVVKQKFTLKAFSNVHNAFLVWLSAYMCYNILYEAFAVRGYKLFGNDNDDTEEATTVDLSSLTKAFEASLAVLFLQDI